MYYRYIISKENGDKKKWIRGKSKMTVEMVCNTVKSYYDFIREGISENVITIKERTTR